MLRMSACGMGRTISKLMDMTNTISNNFKQILKKQQGLEYHFINIIRQPATQKDLLSVETELNFSLNDELKELYLFADGTDIDNKTPSGLTGLIPIHNFLSLNDAIFYYKTSIKFEDAFYNSEKDYKPGEKLFPFLEDGAGNCYWVDLNNASGNYGKIFWTNTFGQEPDYTFSSLSSMFQVITDAYNGDIITIDEKGYLDCDYNAFEKLCRDQKL